MLWGCISSKGVGNLVVAGGIMYQYAYKQLFRENLEEPANKMSIWEIFKLFQNSDPKRKTHIVRSLLLFNYPKVIEMVAQIIYL